MKFDPRSWLGQNWWPTIIAAAALLLVFYLVVPLLDGIILGVVFAYVGRPIRDLFGKRKHLGSLVATFCIILPILIIVDLGFIEIINQVMWVAGHQSEMLSISHELIASLAIPPVLYEELMGSIRNIMLIATSVAEKVPLMNLGRSLSLGLINFIISLPVCYFLLQDGDRLKDAVLVVLPPEKTGIDERYISRVDRILSGIFLGSIYTAIAGGAVSVVIFYIFGVPRPLAMASIVFLAGMVPFLTWLVFIPTSVYRYFTFGPLDALTFFLAGSVLVHIAELVIRPFFVSTKSSLHPLLVLISFMGGGLVAGIGGFFLAPALIGIVLGIYQVTRDEIISDRKEAEVSDLAKAPGPGEA
ncbi:MAG TPA: AI-2E family transporter [Methanotrichaceae archaeon]|nr:AI-2E family transporter [Methanotrichaceae archaeon]